MSSSCIEQRESNSIQYNLENGGFQNIPCLKLQLYYNKRSISRSFSLMIFPLHSYHNQKHFQCHFVPIRLPATTTTLHFVDIKSIWSLPCRLVLVGLVSDQPWDLFHCCCQTECMFPWSGRLIVLSLLPNVVSVPAAGVGGAYRRAALRPKQVCACAESERGRSNFFFSFNLRGENEAL